MLATDLQYDIDYPISDGQPVAESEFHFRELVALVWMLDRFFQDRVDVYVCGNNFVYYEEGNREACFSPDAYVVFGVAKILRDSFKTWEEGGHVPAIVFEVTSPKTKLEDLGNKKAKCAVCGVEEYFMYDPRGEYLTPPLKGYRLKDGDYVPIAPDSKSRIHSSVLDLNICLDDSGLICLLDPKTKKPLMRMAEIDKRLVEETAARRVAEAARRKAETAARREAAARKKAETDAAEARKQSDAEIARLKQELKRLKNGSH